MTEAQTTASTTAGPSVGGLLTAARTERGLTVDDVAASTRIRGAVIREIEADRFEACGGTVYARGHIRAIASTVGLDPVQVLAVFDRDHVDPQVTLHDSLPEAPHERRGPNWWAAAAVALGIVTVLSAASILRGTVDQPTDSVAADTPASVVASPAPTKKPVAVTPRGPATVAAAAVSVQLRITGVKSWVRVTNSSRRTLFEGQLTTGQSQLFTDARQISVLLGNAGAVQFVVNGRNLGTAGGLGEVKRVVFGPGDPAAPAQG